jgi:hypothetical protein
MPDKRILDLTPPVTKRTIGDVMAIDGATTRSITARNALGQKEPVPVSGASASVAVGENAVVIQRAAPSTTAIALMAVSAQDGIPVVIVDWSTSVVEHAITITPDGTETIMGKPSITIYSTADQLAGVKLYPSTNLAGWYIAP